MKASRLSGSVGLKLSATSGVGSCSVTETKRTNSLSLRSTRKMDTAVAVSSGLSGSKGCRTGEGERRSSCSEGAGNVSVIVLSFQDIGTLLNRQGKRRYLSSSGASGGGAP